MNDDVFDGYGIEISLASPNDFLKVKETLTRVGVGSKKKKTLYQSCHIFHKKGRYAIVHFKEMFALDGVQETELSDEDIGRRNLIATMLQEWGLVKILDEFEPDEPISKAGDVLIIQHRDKQDWQLVSKYKFSKGKK